MHNKAELIFMKWKGDLAEMDRSKPMVEGNFELIFDSFYRAKIQMKDALPYLNQAIKAHHPSSFMVKGVYKKMKKYPNTPPLDEFESSWKEMISDTAKRVFFAFYEIEGIGNVTNEKIGGQSKAARTKQRQYLDSIPTVDWEAIIREREETTTKELDIDVSNINVNVDLGDL